MPRTMSLWTALFLLPGVANAQGPAATTGQGKDQMPAMTFHDVLEPRQLEWDALYQPASPNSLLPNDRRTPGIMNRIVEKTEDAWCGSFSEPAGVNKLSSPGDMQAPVPLPFGKPRILNKVIGFAHGARAEEIPAAACAAVAPKAPLPSYPPPLPFDKAVLRSAACLPRCLPAYRWGLGVEVEVGLVERAQFDPVKRIARLQRELTGNPDDAESYAELADLYEKQGSTDLRD